MLPPVKIPDTAAPVDAAGAPVTEIGMARRARVAELENEKLARELVELRARLARVDVAGDLIAGEGKPHDPARCEARAPGGARHPVVRVDGKERAVECQICGAELDPIDVLLSYAHAERMFSYHVKSVREEVDRLRAERDRLKDEAKRLKAQVRRRTRTAAVPREKVKVAVADPEEAKAWARQCASTLGTEKSDG